MLRLVFLQYAKKAMPLRFFMLLGVSASLQVNTIFSAELCLVAF